MHIFSISVLSEMLSTEPLPSSHPLSVMIYILFLIHSFLASFFF